jgi:hypothetical protein
MAFQVERPWEFMAKDLDFGFGLWKLHTMPGRRLHFPYFIDYSQPISLDSQQSLATQSHGLSTWKAIVWSGPKYNMEDGSGPSLEAQWQLQPEREKEEGGGGIKKLKIECTGVVFKHWPASVTRTKANSEREREREAGGSGEDTQSWYLRNSA